MNIRDGSHLDCWKRARSSPWSRFGRAGCLIRVKQFEPVIRVRDDSRLRKGERIWSVSFGVPKWRLCSQENHQARWRFFTASKWPTICLAKSLSLKRFLWVDSNCYSNGATPHVAYSCRLGNFNDNLQFRKRREWALSAVVSFAWKGRAKEMRHEFAPNVHSHM